MQQWEYREMFADFRKVVQVNHQPTKKPEPTILDYLNQAGREGWEVIAVTSFGAGGEYKTYILKRPLTTEG